MKMTGYTYKVSDCFLIGVQGELLTVPEYLIGRGAGEHAEDKEKLASVLYRRRA